MFWFKYLWRIACFTSVRFLRSQDIRQVVRFGNDFGRWDKPGPVTSSLTRSLTIVMIIFTSILYLWMMRATLDTTHFPNLIINYDNIIRLGDPLREP